MGLALLASGSVFYVLLYRGFMYGLKKLNQSLNDGDVSEISSRLVSAVQGIVACIIGWIIFQACSGDILYDTHWLTNTYTWFTIPYFFYDVFSMYDSFAKNRPHYINKPFRYVFPRFFIKEFSMMVHHLVLPVIFIPVILFLRKDVGDYFVAIFFMFEVPIPFISTRFILLQLKMEGTTIYVINGILLMITWTVFRVLVFPYLYVVFANYRNIPFHTVPFSIPIKCNMGCILLMSLQLYWLRQIFSIAVRTVSKKLAEANSKQSIDQSASKNDLFQNGSERKTKAS